MSTSWPPNPPTGKRSSSRLGRPRDVHLTQRLKEHALLLVAERGFSGLNVDVLTARTGAGRGGVYRRWDTMADLVADALSDHHLIPDPTHTSSVVDDLCNLLRAFTAPLTIAERAAAAILGPARTNPALADALHATVVEPLHTALASTVTAHTLPGTPLVEPRDRLLQTVVVALWWDRCITTRDALTRDQLEQLVTRSLLPILHRASA